MPATRAVVQSLLSPKFTTPRCCRLVSVRAVMTLFVAGAMLTGCAHRVVVDCRPARGFAAGEAGDDYPGVCPEHLEPAFLVAYEAGRQVHLATTVVQETRREMLLRQQRLDAVKADRDAVQSALISDLASAHRRSELLLQLYDLRRRQRDLEQEIGQLEQALDRQQERLMVARDASVSAREAP
jgi:hypothetical protein